MSLYKDPIAELLGAIAQYNNLTLNPADYTFGAPEVNPDTTTYPTNTRITLTANNTTVPYQGGATFYYDRLDLADLAKLVNLSVKATAITTSHDLIPVLNERFGLNLTTADIVLNDAVDHVDYKTVTLIAEATSMGWIGQVDVSVAAGQAPLANYLTVTELPGLEYPTLYPTLPFAQFYSYWRDFSAYTTYLKTLTAGAVIDQQLADALTAVTGDTWLMSYGQYSLLGATIVYAGSTVGQTQFNDAYNYAVQITLNHDNATGITGDLILHFSDPVNPGVV